MFNQKGQIHIILLVLLAFGLIIYFNFNFSGSSIADKWLKGYKITPQTRGSPAISTPSVSTPSISTPPVSAPALVVPTLSDAAPPTRLNPKPTGNLPPETRRVTMSLETNEKANCRYGDVSGVYYDSMQGKFDQTNSVSHSVLITTLSEGGRYKYYVRCADEQGNKNSDDLIISFGVKMPEDKTPPVLSNPSHLGNILPKNTKEAIISISTDEPASCRYSGSAAGSFSYYDQTRRFHVKQIIGLVNGKSYDFFVRCTDLAGNANTGDVLISFKIDNS